MKKTAIIFFSLMFLGFYSNAQQESFFKKADAFFKSNVTEGRVKYKGIKQNSSVLNNLTDYVANVDVSQFSSDEKKAFYLNAYNILVIKNIIDAYPIDSPMSIDGFFDKKKQTVAGEVLTLNEIENKKIREVYKDSRIHFALVCAAKGCPEIASFAFTPEMVDEQLQQLTTKAINNSDFTKVNKSEKQVMLSEIFNWYKQDFLNEAPDLLAYINKYRKEKLDKNFKVSHYSYNWELNEADMHN
ncbi:DUF547 domain-containing protein [Chondrinema litorale]|uniref:DUF547 domain-containing protein n=1 Tax=Chondrinema litorale TaxID=2994555 RepID=UPI002542AFDB|nr:DUF547 domain-containing protein [Chondrinema litorale]UZR94480.1 DUF547 domain-containing protein [Chondrinema litorale]